MRLLFVVTPEGLKPPTCRTGICRSIQLNYGAGCVKSNEITHDLLF